MIRQSPFTGVVLVFALLLVACNPPLATPTPTAAPAKPTAAPAPTVAPTTAAAAAPTTAAATAAPTAQAGAGTAAKAGRSPDDEITDIRNRYYDAAKREGKLIIYGAGN